MLSIVLLATEFQLGSLPHSCEIMMATVLLDHSEFGEIVNGVVEISMGIEVAVMNEMKMTRKFF